MNLGSSTKAPVGASALIASRRSRRRIVRAVLLTALLAIVAAGVTSLVRTLRRPPELVVVAAEVEDVSRMLAVTGRVEAQQTVSVAPQVGGRITEIVRREGEVVKKGDVLARLADPSARSEVVQRQASLASKESELAQAKRELDRTSSLVERGALAPAELESARLSVSRASEEVNRLRSLLQEGRSQLVLLAPFDGTIVRRDGELGQVVGPQSEVFEIATVTASRVTAEVDERYVRALRTGMRAEILPVGEAEPRQPATVSYVAQSVDPETGAATVRFEYEHAPKDVLVGMSVDVNVSVETVKAALTIPTEAVGGAGAHPFVLVVNDGRVVRREIVVDEWPSSRVVVRSGLERGEQVALDPKGAVVGARVQPRTRGDVAPEGAHGP